MSEPKYAWYPGDVTDIVGEKFHSEFIRKDGFDAVRTWVATAAEYDFQKNQTRVEFDELG